jgi:radical SAM superfamily enzyme YgiQ (UPF0313 family)
MYRYRKGIFKKPIRYAPLTLTTLAALVPDELNAQVDIIDEGIEEIPDTINADIIGISAITGSANRAYQIADTIRKQKNAKVVLGGVHPTLMPYEAIQHADSVVIGFAEKTFPELLVDYKNGRLQKFYIQDNNLSLDNVPLPRRDLLQKNKYITVNTVQATRGCVNACEFCVVPVAWKRRMYFRPVREVIREIETFESKEFIFLDVSPVENKQYIKKLYRELVPLHKNWASPATIKIAQDHALLSLAVKSGCKAVLIGFESILEDSIKGINKNFNTVKTYKKNIQILHDNGIAIMGCFVFGCDWDDKHVFEKTVDFVLDTNIDLPRYTVYTPFPGTPLYERLKRENRIMENDWDYYDAQHVVYKPTYMSPEELTEGLIWAWNETYKNINILKRCSKLDATFFTRLLANIGYKYYASRLAKNIPYNEHHIN